MVSKIQFKYILLEEMPGQIYVKVKFGAKDPELLLIDKYTERLENYSQKKRIFPIYNDEL